MNLTNKVGLSHSVSGKVGLVTTTRKKYVPEFIPEFVPEFDLNTDFYPGTNSGMNSRTNFFYIV